MNRNKISRLFLNDTFILSIVLLNTLLIILEEYGLTMPWVLWADFACTVVFLVEMFCKMRVYGVRGYWQSGWNRFDGTLVILSLPSLIEPFISIGTYNISVILVLRLLRILRFFRLFHFFPNFSALMKGLHLAMKQTWAVLIGYFVFILAFAIISCSLFSTLVPDYFDTPLNSLYSIFRLFTIEGWYEIPDAITVQVSGFAGFCVRVYFVVLLVAGGIIGMSFVNSIFVDAMVADNNDEIKEQLAQMERKIDKLLEENEALKREMKH